MATTSYGVDKNSIYDSVVETTGSGVSMSKGVEVNIDLSKITTKDEALKCLEQVRGSIMESANWPA